MNSTLKTAAAAVLATALGTGIALGTGMALAAGEHSIESHDMQAGTDRSDCGPGQRMGRMGGKDRGFQHAAVDKNLTADEVKTIVAGRVAYSGNKRLKVGKATEKDKDTVAVDIVTVDNSLVRTIDIDRHTGRPKRPAPAK